MRQIGVFSADCFLRGMTRYKRTLIVDVTLRLRHPLGCGEADSLPKLGQPASAEAATRRQSEVAPTHYFTL